MKEKKTGGRRWIVLIALAAVLGASVGLTACGTVTNKYTVAFQSNGGTAVESIVAEAGTKITEPTKPTKDGWVFAGWYRDADLLERFTFPATMPEESFNLYAKWTLSDQMTLSFDSKGGTAVAPITAAALSTVAQPDAPEKDGRFFSGWFVDEACTIPFDFVMPARDATVYARWLKLEEATAFDLNQGWISGDEGAYTLTEGADGTFIKALPGKDTYSLVGVKIPHNVKNYSAFVMTFTGTAGQDILLKCQNGGVTAIETRVTMTGVEQTVVWTVGAANLTDGAVPMDFYIFVRPGQTGAGAELTIKSLDLYRVRGEEEPFQSAIFFDSTGGSAVNPLFAETDAAVTQPTEVPEKAGYTFGGWCTDKEGTKPFTFTTMPAGKTFVYAKWEPNTDVTLTFDSKGGTAVDSITLPATADLTGLRPADPTKDGVIFDDWYLDEQFTKKFDFKKMPATDATVYARWTVLEQTSKMQLSLDLTAKNGGYEITPGEGQTTVAIAGKSSWDMFGTQVTLNAKAYSYFSVTFTGTAGKRILFKCQNGGVTVVETSIEMTGEQQTFLWRVKDVNLPDGTSAMDFYMCLDPGTAYTDAPATPVAATFTEIALLRLKTDGAADSYAVHFAADGGRDAEGNPLTAQFNAPDAQLTLPAPIKTGYTFAGWYTDAALDTPFTATQMPSENLVLYAKYTAASAPVTLDPDNWSTVAGYENYSVSVGGGDKALVAFNHTENAWNAKAGAAYVVTDTPMGFSSASGMTFTLDAATLSANTTVRLRFFGADENYTYNSKTTATFQFTVTPENVGVEQTVTFDASKLSATQRAHYEELLSSGNFCIQLSIYTGTSNANYGAGTLTLSSVTFR